MICLRLSLIITLLLSGVAWGRAPADSDAARLNEGLPRSFQRIELLIYPPTDQRPLAADGSPLAPPKAWTQFLDALSARRNLRIHPPASTLAKIRKRSDYQRGLRLAQAAAQRGQDDYRRVKLDRATESLAAAIDAMTEIEHHIIDPNGVARLALLHAQALLEGGHKQRAGRAFQQALTFDSHLRLIPGTDSPAAIRALEEARSSLKPGTPARIGARANPGPRRYIVRTRIMPDLLHITVQSVGGLRVEQMALNAPDAGNRLANRIWTCLPFGRSPRRRADRRRLFLDAGFNYDTFINSSAVDLFSNFGAGLNISWIPTANLAFDANLSLTNSNRDPNEDLREDISTARLFAGPGFIWRAGPFRAGVNVGFSAETISPVITTRNVACKFFKPDDAVPLCKPEQDIEHVERSWRVGPAMTVSGSLQLVNQLYVSLRVLTATSIFDSVDTGLGFPLGAQLSLGYRLF